MRKHLYSIILVSIFFVGVSVLLYPTLSDWWNRQVQSEAIVDYDALTSALSEEDYSREFKNAKKYNDEIKKMSYPLFNHYKLSNYNDILNVSGNGMIGYITISKIDVQLPIYHGTDESTLNTSVGHLEGSSLPIGGKGTHSVLSAHRGLPSAKLFTNLDKLKYDDTFTINVLNRMLTYKVDQIRIVSPEDVEELYIKDDKDYCTLVTCTPYGINTHRLFVRGVRIPNDIVPDFVQTEAYEIDSIILAPAVAAPMLLVLLIILLVKYRKKKTNNIKI